MNKFEIKQLEERIEYLDGFVISKDEFTENEIIDWIADSVSLFSELDINSEIISNFLDLFKNETKEVDEEFNFDYEPDILIPGTTPRKKFRSVIGPFKKKGFLEGYILYSNPYYRKIAFNAAKTNLKKKQDDLRLIPVWLINELSSFSNKYEHIISSLELMETSYQSKNSDGLLKNSRTLLSSILNLDSELVKRKQDLGPQLESLIKDNKINKLGVGKDFLIGLNNCRIIRNTKVDHKDLPLKYDIPFVVAVSCAYLVIIFLEMVISKGELIK